MTQTQLIAIRARTIIEQASATQIKIATAESCTGGMISAALTDIPGSSAVFERGFVTYTNEAKQELLGAPRSLFQTVGAVSAEVARAMAEGALHHSNADLSVSVTGIAGPGGGDIHKPVGLVWFGLAQSGHSTRVERRVFASGSRSFVRTKATETAMLLLLSALGH